MNIISELYNNMKNYFFTVKGDEAICCGGSESGRFYGIIEIHFPPDVLRIDKTVSNGSTSSMILSPERYSSSTDEYKLAIKLQQEVRDYLAHPANRIFQDENRAKLMSNTQNLLPQYEN